MAKRYAMESQAKFVKEGYGQVEPNHLSAQRTAQIYAQLPAAADIEILENGQFVKYDYKAGVCDFVGAGEWMLVFNEVKVYRDFEGDADFAMLKDNYVARVYAPGQEDKATINMRYYAGKDAEGNDIEKVTTKADPYEIFSTEDPYKINIKNGPIYMKEKTNMVPRVFKTNVGDIFTTNCVDEESLAVGNILSPRDADGILVKVADGANPAMKWEVVKVYTMPDHQPGVKIMRIA